MGKKQEKKVTKNVEPVPPVSNDDEMITRRDLQDWFDHWTDTIGTHLPGLFNNRLPEMWGAGRELSGVIKIEETVSEDAITLRGEMPGVEPEKDIEVLVDEGRLVIRAERRESSEATEGSSTRSEFRYGSYRRSFDLPPGADVEKIVASYENGILDVRIPLDLRRPEPKRVSVSVN